MIFLNADWKLLLSPLRACKATKNLMHFDEFARVGVVYIFIDSPVETFATKLSDCETNDNAFLFPVNLVYPLYQ